MKFLEKNLEQIIHENYEACYNRGLHLGVPYLLRQPSLGAYGTADLIGIDFDCEFGKHDNGERARRTMTITIVECKQNEVGMKAYLQAKRYKTAIKHLLKNYNLKQTAVEFRIALIGRELESRTDFEYQLNDDDDCTVFLYEYGVDGIKFTEVGSGWHRPGGISNDVLAKSSLAGREFFRDYMKGYNEKLSREYEAYREHIKITEGYDIKTGKDI